MIRLSDFGKFRLESCFAFSVTGVGENIFGHSGGVTAIAFHPDGKSLASAAKDKSIKVWRLGDDIYDSNYGKVIMTLTGHLQQVRAIAFSPDGKTLASGGPVSYTHLTLPTIAKV